MRLFEVRAPATAVHNKQNVFSWKLFWTGVWQDRRVQLQQTQRSCSNASIKRIRARDTTTQLPFSPRNMSRSLCMSDTLKASYHLVVMQLVMHARMTVVFCPNTARKCKPDGLVRPGKDERCIPKSSLPCSHTQQSMLHQVLD